MMGVVPHNDRRASFGIMTGVKSQNENHVILPSTKIEQMVLLCQKNKEAARGLVKKCLTSTSPPEPLVRLKKILHNCL